MTVVDVSCMDHPRKHLIHSNLWFVLIIESIPSPFNEIIILLRVSLVGWNEIN